MAIQKSIPMQRVIGGKVIDTSEICFVSDLIYQTNGEELVITKDIDDCQILLNSKNTDHIIIKSLTKTKIRPLEGLIDEEFSEINLEKGSCVELYFSFGNWYVVSSDGIKSN